MSQLLLYQYVYMRSLGPCESHHDALKVWETIGAMVTHWSVLCVRLWKRKSLILVSLMAQDLSVCECVFVCLPCSRFECNIQTGVLCFCHICPNTHAHAAGTNQPNASIQPSVVHYHPLPWHSTWLNQHIYMFDCVCFCHFSTLPTHPRSLNVLILIISLVLLYFFPHPYITNSVFPTSFHSF